MRSFIAGHITVTGRVHELLGLAPLALQARILVAASSKAEALRLLSLRGLAPNPVVVPAADRDIIAMHVASLHEAPGVFALRPDGDGPVVRMEPGGDGTLLGRLERYTPGSRPRFIPAPAGAAPAWTEPVTLDLLALHVAEQYGVDAFDADQLVREAVLGIIDDPAKADHSGPEPLVLPTSIDEVLDAVDYQYQQSRAGAGEVIEAARANQQRVAELNQELKTLHRERRVIARRATEAAGADLLAEVAKAFDVTPARVYQLRDEALVLEAQRRAESHSGARS